MNPAGLAAHPTRWAKVAAIYYKCVAYLMDPATRADAIKIMAAKVGADPVVYAKYVPARHFRRRSPRPRPTTRATAAPP